VRASSYSFRQRQHGESKLDTMIAWEFGMLLADKLIGHIVPVRFARFFGDRCSWAGSPSRYLMDEFEFLKVRVRCRTKCCHAGGDDFEFLLE